MVTSPTKKLTLIEYISPGTPICELTYVGLSTLRSRKRDVRLFFGLIRLLSPPKTGMSLKSTIFLKFQTDGVKNTRINPKKSLTSLFRDLRVESPTWVNSQIGVPGEMYSIKVEFFLFFLNHVSLITYLGPLGTPEPNHGRKMISTMQH